MNARMPTTEAVLSSVSPETQLFFYEELEKIAATYEVLSKTPTFMRKVLQDRYARAYARQGAPRRRSQLGLPEMPVQPGTRRRSPVQRRMEQAKLRSAQPVDIVPAPSVPRVTSPDPSDTTFRAYGPSPRTPKPQAAPKTKSPRANAQGAPETPKADAQGTPETPRADQGASTPETPRAVASGAAVQDAGEQVSDEALSRIAQAFNVTKDRARSILGSTRSAIAGLPKNVESLAESLGQGVSTVLGGGAAGAASATRGLNNAVSAFNAGLRGLDENQATLLGAGQKLVADLAKVDDELRILSARRNQAGKIFGRDKNAPSYKEIQKQIDNAKDRRKELLASIGPVAEGETRTIDNSGLPQAIKDRIQSTFGDKVSKSSSEAQSLLSYMGSDDAIRDFGGSPVDPATMDMVGSIVRRMFGGDSSRQATEAASGLGKALSEIPPAYLAAAAGAGGVAGGMMLGSGPS